MPSPTTDGLARVLSDYQVLYQKLRGYHWNITGPAFYTLHPEFENLYNAVAAAVDEIAERLRALGVTPPSTYAAQLEQASLSEDPTVPDDQAMVRNLIADYQKIGQAMGELIQHAEAQGDRTTANLLDGLADADAKTVWMLRSHLG